MPSFYLLIRFAESRSVADALWSPVFFLSRRRTCSAPSSTWRSSFDRFLFNSHCSTASFVHRRRLRIFSPLSQNRCIRADQCGSSGASADLGRTRAATDFEHDWQPIGQDGVSWEEEKGFDGNKNVKGRLCHIVVNVLLKKYNSALLLQHWNCWNYLLRISQFLVPWLRNLKWYKANNNSIKLWNFRTARLLRLNVKNENAINVLSLTTN